MKSWLKYYIHKIIRKIRVVLGLEVDRPLDIDVDSIVGDPKYQQLNKELDLAYEEHILAMPRPEEQKTVYIYSEDEGPSVNIITAYFYRRQIAKQYKRLRVRGIDTFICDYMTPLGLLALEELDKLRKRGENFNLYCLRYRKPRKTYRLIKEFELGILFLTCRSDYDYGRIEDLCELKIKILDHCCLIITNINHGCPHELTHTYEPEGQN